VLKFTCGFSVPVLCSSQIDIKHHVSACAVMTLGKDMTFRDYAQGAFRMRQIGIGQKIHLYVIPEVLKLIERELRLDGDGSANGPISPSRKIENPALLENLSVHVAAWLTINSMRQVTLTGRVSSTSLIVADLTSSFCLSLPHRMEQLQFFQLSLQNLHTVWRKKAFADLLQDSSTASPAALQHRRHLRYDLNLSSSFPRVFWLVECINLFKQPIEFTIEDHIPVYKPFFAALKTLLSQHTTFIKDDSQCLAIGSILTLALSASSAILPRHSYDREMVNEQEQEQEQEKHQEVLKDPRAQRNEEEHRAWKIDKLKETSLVLGADSRTINSAQVLPTTNTHPFYSLASFSLEGRPLPLSFPRYLLMSHNFYRQSWSINPGGHRRLKNVYVVMELILPPAGASSGPAGAAVDAAAGEQLQPTPLTVIQSDRWKRLFLMLDSDSDGFVSKPDEIEGLRRVLSTMLNEEVPRGFFSADVKLTQEQTMHLLRAVTRAQDVNKVAGFLSREDGAAESAMDLVDRTSSEDANRFFTILPLSEAQALRRAVHTTHPLFSTKNSAAAAASNATVQFAMWSLDGHLVETTPGYVSAKRGERRINYQVNLTLQTARFMNGELYYTDEELVSLLRSISEIHPSHRRTLMEQLLLCRHRDHRTLQKTPLEAAMTFSDEAHWFLLRTILITFRARLDAKKLSLLQAFHLFDLDGNGFIDAGELWTAFTFLGFAGSHGDSSSGLAASPAQVTPNDVMDVLRFGDAGGDGSLDFEEFTRAFRTREEGHDGARIEEVNEDASSSEERKDDSASSDSPPPVDLPKLELIPMPAPQRPSPPPAYERPRVTAPAAAPSHVSPQPPAAAAYQAAPAQPAFQPAPPQQPARPMVVATAEWACGVCTYINRPGQSRCSMCDTPKS
jgi:Ca2+-binding EF-hand superfamily protein